MVLKKVCPTWPNVWLYICLNYLFVLMQLAAILFYLLFAEFRNDHSDITRKIDLNLQILHSRKVNQDAFSQTGMNSGKQARC